MFEKINKEVEGGKWVAIAFALTIAILASLFLLVNILTEVKAYSFIGSGIAAEDTISVSGKGEVFAAPDIVQISFSVVEEGDTVAEAQEIASIQINQVMAFLDENKIEDKDIKTSNYSVYPRYEYLKAKDVCNEMGCWPTPGERTLAGYNVNQTISVKIREIDNAGLILAGVGEIGVSNISGLNFQIDDEEALKREARQLAIEDAKDKARAISRDLGVDISRIVGFSESGNYPMYKTFGVEMAAMDGRGGGVIPEIPMGENQITSNVTITYEIK